MAMPRSERRFADCLVSAALAALVAFTSPSILAQGTWRVSVDSSGAQASTWSSDPAVSEDGRFVAFSSMASDLVPGDTNGWIDIFVHDRQTGMTTRVSVDSAAGQANSFSGSPSLSGDGRFVAFQSVASNLVPGDTNGQTDVFVHDRQTATTTRVSVGSAGAEGDRHSIAPSISADGRCVAFYSKSSNLVPGDTNGQMDVFVHHCQTGTTTRVSVDSTGVEGDGASTNPSLSGDGRFVAFESLATNLVPLDTNGLQDVFVHDLQTSVTTLVSIGIRSADGQGDGLSHAPSISRDGRFVAFESTSSNLGPQVTGGPNVFVRDRATSTTTCVSVDSAGKGGGNSPSISGDGHVVAFESAATNLVPEDHNHRADVFTHDCQTGTNTLINVAPAGLHAWMMRYLPAISGDGRMVAFESFADHLVPGDTNGSLDVFIHGPYLTLQASPEGVTVGDTLTFTTWSGLPGTLTFLAAVDVGGVPIFVPVAFGTFDRIGLWTLAGQVPPGLAGSRVTFQGFGFSPSGKVDPTNAEAVTFQ